MGQPSILVIDGNRAATREQQVAAGGQATGEGYAQVLKSLADVECDIVRPADGEVRFASGSGLASYDGVAITGSALNVYEGGAPIERQIGLARATFAAGVPFFGSCWGLQVAVSAAGGRVRRNPLGREFGFARRIELEDAGRRHGMFRGKPPVFEAITVHRGRAISSCSPRARLVLASNDMGLQAIENSGHGAGTFWGVQYHPEYSFAEIAATALRYSAVLIEERLFADRAELEAFVTADLRALMHNPRDRRLTWKHGLGVGLQEESRRLAGAAQLAGAAGAAGTHGSRHYERRCRVARLQDRPMSFTGRGLSRSLGTGRATGRCRARDCPALFPHAARGGAQGRWQSGNGRGPRNRDRDAPHDSRGLSRARHSGRGVCFRRGGEFTWVLDPIDGTKEFRHPGIPNCSGSLIALLQGGRAVLGVIEAPALAERWVEVVRVVPRSSTAGR